MMPQHPLSGRMDTTCVEQQLMIVIRRLNVLECVMEPRKKERKGKKKRKKMIVTAISSLRYAVKVCSCCRRTQKYGSHVTGGVLALLSLLLGTWPRLTSRSANEMENE